MDELATAAVGYLNQQAIRMNFDVPIRMGSVMAGFPRPWCIAGGWALDLHLNRVTRPHGDIEILIFREDRLALQAYLTGFDLTRIAAGKEYPWLKAEEVAADSHQTRARSAEFEFDVFCGDTDGQDWMYRRDRRVRCARNEAIRTSESGLPILAPEIALLFKAKYFADKDRADFKQVMPHLSADGREWLRCAIEQAHPERTSSVVNVCGAVSFLDRS